VVFVSATPSEYEIKSSKQIVEQIIRPTGLIDPEIVIKDSDTQIKDVLEEIKKTVKESYRILVTTLTKKLSEEITDFFASKGIRVRYLHSEIDSIERSELIRQLRLGKFDVIVGINLLREGLDIPEVGLVAILDADKEGFLRDERSLIQTIGRAARNSESRVILYAKNITKSITNAIEETNRRRNIQTEYNKKMNITPKSIVKPISEKLVTITDDKMVPKSQIPNLVIELESQMRASAERLDFEMAIKLREKIQKLKKKHGLD
jgi:excinuclease ABC subunit B